MNVNKAAIKALYHCGRLVELNIQQDPNSLQVCKQGHTVNFWGIREEIRQTLGRMKRGEGEEEPAVHSMEWGSQLVCAGGKGGPHKCTLKESSSICK